MSPKSKLSAVVPLALAIPALGLAIYSAVQIQQLPTSTDVDGKVGSLRAEVVEAQKASSETFEQRVEKALESIIERRQAEAQEARKAQQPPSASIGSLSSDGMLSMNEEGQVVYGDPDAPVTVITFEDFRCGYCAKYHPALQQFVNESDGEVNWIYKPFPILGPASETLALAGECVSQLEGAEAFWRFSDQAYATKNWNTAVKYSELDDPDAVRNCVSENAQGDRVASSIAEGRELNITGTPASVFRNNETEQGAFVPGYLQPHQIAQMVKEVSND